MKLRTAWAYKRGEVYIQGFTVCECGNGFWKHGEHCQTLGYLN